MKGFVKTSIEKIRHASNNNQLVVFVGSGVSLNSGCVSWQTLVNKFADELGMEIPVPRSLDMYLKIPQYYYIERGYKEYFDIIRKVLNNKDYEFNSIDELIFDLNPYSVITTNFDDLLEKTIDKKRLLYDVVKKDDDLPYCSNKMLIKMHGDIELRNIILKEDDYVRYSELFPLVENYIKGLFSTKTILFIGYSADDPDFKAIFDWVKNKLGNNFQPAYLLESEKHEERINYTYYKNRGINILYYDAIKNEVEKAFGKDYKGTLVDEIGQRLEYFLRYIINYEDIQTRGKGLLYSISRNLEEYKDLRYVFPDDVAKILRGTVYCDEIEIREKGMFNQLTNSINQDNNENSKVESNYEDDKNREFIYKIMKKADINKVILMNGINKEKEFKIDENFKYEIEKIDELEKAFEYYLSGEYVKSGVILKEFAQKCFRTKKYLYYYICLFNLKQIRNFIAFNKNEVIDKDKTELLKYINQIDLEHVFVALPKEEQIATEFISKFVSYDFFDTKFRKMSELNNSIKDSCLNIRRGGISINNNFYEIDKLARNLDSYMRRNYLMLNKYKGIQILFSTYINSVISICSICNDEDLGDIFDEFVVDIILSYVSRNDFSRFCDENNLVRLKLNENIYDYIKNILGNLIDDVRVCNYSGNTYSGNKIDVILKILEIAELNTNQVNKIIMHLTDGIGKGIYNPTHHRNIYLFILKKFNESKEKEDLTSIGEFLNKYIKENKMLDVKSWDKYYLDAEGYISDYSSMLLQVNYEFNEEFEDVIKSMINICKESLNSNRMNVNVIKAIVSNTLIPICHCITKELVSELEGVCNILLEKIKDDKYNYYKFKYCVIFSDIISVNTEESKLIVREFNQYIKECLKEEAVNKSEGITTIRMENYSKSEEVMTWLLDLIVSCKIKYNDVKELCTDLKNEHKLFDFFVEPENFDYTNFDVKWLSFISDSMFSDIIKNRNVKIAISSKVGEEILAGNLVLSDSYSNKVAMLLKQVN